MKKRDILILVFTLAALVAVVLIVRAMIPEVEIPEIEPPESQEIERAEPYISEIVTRDSELRELASSIVARYPGASETKEGQVNALYRYIVENFAYYSDPRGAEYIQSPYETLNVKGGDCEDLTILLCSLLENLGLRTYLVLTPDHAYALISGISTENLWTWIEKSLEEQFLKDNPQYISTREETFLLRAGYLRYIGGDGSKFPFEVARVGDSKIVAKSLEIDYHVKSSQPLDVYIVPSKSDYEALVRGEIFNNYPKCKKSQIYEASGECVLGRYGGIALQNRSSKDSSVTLSVSFSYKFSFEDLEITYFTLKGQKSVVLEPTAGEYGYVGYCPPYPEDTKIVAIDPITKEYFYLKFQQ
jgi:hypothetical protein